MALLIALALHAALAVAIAVYLAYAPATEELAQLDLTSVDLSFSETVEDTSAAVASAPSESAEATSPPRPEGISPPHPVDAASSPRLSNDEPSSSDAAKTPRPQSAVLPTPVEPIEKVTTPVAIESKSDAARQEARDEKPKDARREAREESESKTEDKREDASLRQQAAAAAPSAPQQARVDAQPKPRRSIRPDYPRESRLRGEQGDVALELDVAADGTVSAVRILKSPGFPLLDEAAVKAARAACFTPAKSGGKSVASTVRLTLNFKLK